MAAPVATQVFEDFVPKSELVQEQDADILQIHLPEFKKEQLRVQVTRSGILKISGQRHKGGNKWVRFHKEFPISTNINQHKISAKFEHGILYVRQPKLIIPAEEQVKLPEPQPQLPHPKTMEEPSKKAEEQDKPEITAKDVSKSQPSWPRKTGKETNKKAEEQAKGVSEMVPKSEEAKNAKGKFSELTDAKSATERSVDAKNGGIVEDEMTSKSTWNKKDESDTRNAAKVDGSGTNLATKLRRSRKIMNVALAVLVVVGIGLYVNNMIRSSTKSEE